MNRLDAFLILNEIKRDELLDALYLDIREMVLKEIVEKMKSDKETLLKIKKYYFKYPGVDATRKTIKNLLDLTLPQPDVVWLDKCLNAFMKKKDRNRIPDEVRDSLYKIQNGKCAICGKNISIQEMHVDHIIPCDFVGDELDNNYQGLCADCNLHKSNHVSLAVSNIILNRGNK